MKEQVKIDEHKEQLKQLCNVCRKEKKCKNHDKICTLKKLAWEYAKHRYLKQCKEGGTK